ncbi:MULTISPECIES: hypothetical protein [Mycolicibacterium]|uniref:hypothetical protein n=1 Tax=Mycolicibacterium TaxID=1866885 RepID=UPI00298BEB1A|nr:hypothetical protein [Mycolicibacterium sp. D5.8-2]MDW5610062.1 hypothetical protein [Mycolicibacterium sp. D5.8-2]
MREALAASAGGAAAGWPPAPVGDAGPVAGEPDPEEGLDGDCVEADGELGVPPDDGAEVPIGLDGEEGADGELVLPRPPGVPEPAGALAAGGPVGWPGTGSVDVPVGDGLTGCMVPCGVDG